MYLVRTTITLPDDVHKKLKKEAYDQNKSFNKLVTDKLVEPKKNKKFVVRPVNLGLKGPFRREEIYDEYLNRKQGSY